MPVPQLFHIRSTVLNLVLMGLLMLLMKPAVAMAVMGLVLDVYGVAAAYLFYRRTTRLTPARDSGVPPDRAVRLEQLRASGPDLQP